MRRPRRAVVIATALCATAFAAKGQDGDVATGHAFAREACKACHHRGRGELAKDDHHRASIPRHRQHPRDDGDGHSGLPHEFAPEDAKPDPHIGRDHECERIYPEPPRSSLSSCSVGEWRHTVRLDCLSCSFSRWPARSGRFKRARAFVVQTGHTVAASA